MIDTTLQYVLSSTARIYIDNHFYILIDTKDLQNPIKGLIFHFQLLNLLGIKISTRYQISQEAWANLAPSQSLAIVKDNKTKIICLDILHRNFLSASISDSMTCICKENLDKTCLQWLYYLFHNHLQML